MLPNASSKEISPKAARAPPALRARPSLPSLLSEKRITGRGHASTSSSPAVSNDTASPSIISDVFTPSIEITSADQYLDDSFISESSGDSFNGGKGKDKEEHLQLKLQAQLWRNERQRLHRNDSASTVATRLSSRAKPAHQSDTSDQYESFPFPSSKRRYFILTSAGKPVFASDDTDEELVTSSVGVMQAIISIFADEGDRIRYIDAGNVKISFLLKAPLYYVCVSDFGEPESVLRNHLDYLHMHILSVVSMGQLQRMFAKRSNFDLRRLLEGTDTILSSLIARLQEDFALLTGSLEPARIKQSARDEIGKLLIPTLKNKDILYALVLSRGRVVTLLRPRRHSVHPSDLHLLINTIYASSSLVVPGNENWIPICLPKFNNSGFLHALVSFIDHEIGLIFMSTDKEAFFDIREWKEAVVQKLTESTVAKQLRSVTLQQKYAVGELSIPGLRHFLYKSKTYVQVTSPAWEGDYEDEARRRQIIILYQRIYDQVHLRPPIHGQGRQPVKLVYLHTEHEGVLSWTTSTFELYMALAPLLPKTAAVVAAHGVVKWIKSKESELFLMTAPSF